MKRISFLLAFIFILSFSYLNSQTLFVPGGFSTTGLGSSSTSGNVGIGTPNPSFKCDLNLGTVISNSNIGFNVFGDATGNIGYSGYNLQLNNSTANASGYLRLARTASTAFLGLELGSQSRDGIRFLTHATSPVEVMRIDATGNVGVGTTSPTHKLHVQQNLSGGEVVPLLIQNYNAIPLQGDAVTFRMACTHAPDAQANGIVNLIGTRTSIGSMDLNFLLSPGNGSNPVSSLFIKGSNGYLGIGTTSPQNKLDVNGTIHAREVKVDLTGWSDFVFHPSYQLKPLTEVEKYIQTNGHLEDIPSAEQVEKEGVNVGEMQKKLLQKVEELTLYVIELKKENEQLKQENAKNVEALKSEIEKFKNNKP